METRILLEVLVTRATAIRKVHVVLSVTQLLASATVSKASEEELVTSASLDMQLSMASASVRDKLSRAVPLVFLVIIVSFLLETSAYFIYWDKNNAIPFILYESPVYLTPVI